MEWCSSSRSDPRRFGWFRCRTGRSRVLVLPAASTPIAELRSRSSATLDPALSRWKWLVKWFLAIPHFIVLAFLWVAFVVLTVVAFFAILFTGRYPRGIFDFNVGVLRWTWRVSFYATDGGLGTDRYPPFRLPHSRGPGVARHRLPRAAVSRPGARQVVAARHPALRSARDPGGRDILGAARPRRHRIPAGCSACSCSSPRWHLLFTGRYPVSIFDLVVGLNRWFYRVVAYVALMTDAYPPFRLDQGGTEPQRIGPVEPLGGPDSGAAPHEEGAIVMAVPGQHNVQEAESTQPQPARN